MNADARPFLHVLRTGIGCWMVRLAVSVLPPGDIRETLRMSCAVWIKLMELKANG